MVELPELADVHVAFASSAMCSTCAALAGANAVDELAGRATAGWTDEGTESVVDLVRLVVAAFGHTPPPPDVVPEEFRHREAEPLSDKDTAVWRRLESLMLDGPDHAVRVQGVIEYEADGEKEFTQVDRDGPKARLADRHGDPWLLCDGEHVWRRDDEGMVLSRHTGVDAWAGNGSELAARRTRDDVELFGFGVPLSPIESTTFLGRKAWRFRFAAPEHKPFDMQVVVDDETGLTLEQRFGDFSHGRWVSFETGGAHPDELFVWSGPAVDVESVRNASAAAHDQYEREQSAWFAAHVTSAPLAARGRDVEVMLHVRHDDGSFEASLFGGIEGALARRRRSDDWWRLEWSEVTHRWSDDTWDWALSDFDDWNPPLGTDELAALRQALGAG